MSAQLRLVQRPPLAAGPQDEANRIGTAPIRHARSSSAKAMGMDMDGQQGLEDSPQLIGNAASGCVWCGYWACVVDFVVEALLYSYSSV